MEIFVKRQLVVIVNPYPWVNQKGGANSQEMVDLVTKLKSLSIDEVHWEVVRNHCLFPTDVGEVLPKIDEWPGDHPISDFCNSVDPFKADITPLICLNRHYHGEVRNFLQTRWAQERWMLLASAKDGSRIGNGHIMDHLWPEVEAQSTMLLNEVRIRSNGRIHLDFTRGVALIGFGPPLRAAWQAHELGENDLDTLITLANQAVPEQGPPFSEWIDPPSGVNDLRCLMSQRIIERMLAAAGIENEDVHARFLLRKPEFMREVYGLDIDAWIRSGIASEFSFHNEWVDGEDCEWWRLAPLDNLVKNCHSVGLRCFASVDWYGTGLSEQAPELSDDDPHHVPIKAHSFTEPPSESALTNWATKSLDAGVDGLMLYDAHLGLRGGGLTSACTLLRKLLN